jgi:hypothetical protein
MAQKETAMNKFFVLVLAASVLLPAAAEAGACWRMGQSVQCDNGVSGWQMGGTTHYSNGRQCYTMGQTRYCN